MAKKDGLSNLLLLGGLAIAGYFIYKQFSGQQPQQQGGYSIGWIPGDVTPQTPLNQDENTPTVTPAAAAMPATEPNIAVTPTGDITVIPIQTPIQRPLIQYNTVNPAGVQQTVTIPAPIGVTPATVAANKTSQAWTAATYGQPGQPGVSFLVNTLTAATARNAPTTTRTAAAAVAAGAPPRIVAKIKAGKVY